MIAASAGFAGLAATVALSALPNLGVEARALPGSSNINNNKLALRDLIYQNSSAYEAGAYGQAPNQTFRSSNVNPPVFNVIASPSSVNQLADGYVFLGIRNALGGQSGIAVYDNNATLVYYDQEWGSTMHFREQSYLNQSVLTFFYGSSYSEGYGLGTNIFLDTSYNYLFNVTAQNQTADTSDFHEFQITANNTGLVESWRVVEADLSAVNGPTNGYTWDCVFQEIDIASNELLFEWRSLEHVPISETYFEITNNAGNSSDNPFDYCHLNSLEKDNFGNYIVSLRGPSTVYNISSTGEINWRLGGKNTNFTMGANATFWYQHDARIRDGNRLSVFDNGGVEGAPAEATARGVELQLDFEAMTADLVVGFPAPFGEISGSQGSFQLLNNTNWLAGWGSWPYFTEFSAQGDVLWHVQFGDVESSINSYRAYKSPFVGTPNTQPNISVESTSAGGVEVYTSWNGATAVTGWALLGGSSSGALSSLGSANRQGFETVLNATSTPTYVSVAALDASGACIGVSQVWAVANNSAIGVNGTCPGGGAPTAVSGSSDSSAIAGAASSEKSSAARSVVAVAACAIAPLVSLVWLLA